MLLSSRQYIYLSWFDCQHNGIITKHRRHLISFVEGKKKEHSNTISRVLVKVILTAMEQLKQLQRKPRKNF